MRILRHVLNRHPLPIVGLILVGFGVGVWATTDYIRNTVRPRQAEAHRARIAAEIAEAGESMARRRYELAARQYKFVLSAYGEELDDGQRGTVWHRKGVAHRLAAGRRDATAQLTEAVAALERAVALRPPQSALEGHLESREALGRAQHDRYAATGDPRHLETAITSFEAALGLLPADSAQTAARLHRLTGNAMRDRYAAQPEKTVLEPALNHYQLALHGYAQPESRDRRADVMVEMATARLLRARNLSRPRSEAEAAVGTLEEALESIDRAERPRSYGQTQKLLGDAYTLLAAHPPRRFTASRRYQHKYRYESRARIAYDRAEQFGISRTSALSPEKAVN